MFTRHVSAAGLPTAARSVRRWLFHLGGLGLIPVGILDNLLPIPGTVDVAMILLSAQRERLWLYYGLMATVGSVIGGFAAYRLVREAGKETIERKFSRKTLDKICHIFERWGFAAIAIPALLQPPMPISPFLCAAAVMQYSPRKFLTAVTVGRTVRYLILSFLAARYGRHVMALLGLHRHYLKVEMIVLLIIIVAGVLYLWWEKKNEKLNWKLGGRFFE